jgi:hypothetical protein
MKDFELAHDAFPVARPSPDRWRPSVRSYLTSFDHSRDLPISSNQSRADILPRKMPWRPQRIESEASFEIKHSKFFGFHHMKPTFGLLPPSFVYGCVINVLFPLVNHEVLNELLT